MFPTTPTKISPVKIKAVGSAILYCAFILSTLCLSAIVMGVDLREAVSSYPLSEETIHSQNDTP